MWILLGNSNIGLLLGWCYLTGYQSYSVGIHTLHISCICLLHSDRIHNCRNRIQVKYCCLMNKLHSLGTVSHTLSTSHYSHNTHQYTTDNCQAIHSDNVLEHQHIGTQCRQLWGSIQCSGTMLLLLGGLTIGILGMWHCWQLENMIIHWGPQCKNPRIASIQNPSISNNFLCTQHNNPENCV